MKKYSIIPMLSLFLCGCSSTTAMEVQPTTESAEQELFYNISSHQQFDSVAEFLASDSYTRITDEGYTVYIPTWDEEKYRFTGMASDSDYYELYFHEEATEETIVFNMIYGGYPNNIDQIAEIFEAGSEEDTVMTAEKDDVTYEIYLNKKSHQEGVEYSLHYLPTEGGYISIDTEKSTPEAALAYIHEFTLVPAE